MATFDDDLLSEKMATFDDDLLSEEDLDNIDNIILFYNIIDNIYYF